MQLSPPLTGHRQARDDEHAHDAHDDHHGHHDHHDGHDAHDDAHDLYIIGAVCLSVCLCVSKSHYFCIQRI